MGSYTYKAIVTNLVLQPLNLWRFYNQRARAQLIIRQLKCAYALRKIPTNHFQGNEAFFQIVLLACNLLNQFQRLCVPRYLQQATLQRLFQRLFVAPVQFVRPGGIPTLDLTLAIPRRRLLADAGAHSATAATFVNPRGEVPVNGESEFVEIQKSSFFMQLSG